VDWIYLAQDWILNDYYFSVLKNEIIIQILKFWTFDLTEF
jgi:hypothetical protein